MGSEQTTEAVRTTLRLKLLIAFLAVMTLGQVSAIFIPTFVGQSPAPISGYGTLLWPGLLFMCIWSVKKKSKFNGFLIGAFIGLALFFSTGVIAGYFSAEERDINKAIVNTNKELPKMIDEETRLDKVSIDQKVKEYYYNFTFVNLSLSEIDIKILDENFKLSKQSTCENEAVKVFFSKNYTIIYVYKDKTGQMVRKYYVKQSDCL